MASEDKREATLVALLARNRGELDPARLTALLERLGAPVAAKARTAA